MLFYLLAPFFKLLFGIGFRFPLLCWIVIENRQRVPKSGGLLVIANHISIADPPLLWYALPRFAWWVGRHDIQNIPLVSTIARIGRMIPVKQRQADRKALMDSAAQIEAGNAVVIFPEGEVSPNGKIQPFLPGVSLIVRKTRCRVLPVGLLNAHRIVPHGKLFPRPGFCRLTVRFGEPICFDDVLDAPDASEQIVKRMQDAVAELTGQAIDDPH